MKRERRVIGAGEGLEKKGLELDDTLGIWLERVDRDLSCVVRNSGFRGPEICIYNRGRGGVILGLS